MGYPAEPKRRTEPSIKNIRYSSERYSQLKLEQGFRGVPNHDPPQCQQLQHYLEHAGRIEVYLLGDVWYKTGCKM